MIEVEKENQKENEAQEQKQEKSTSIKDFDYGEMTESMKTYDIGINRGKVKFNGFTFLVKPLAHDKGSQFIDIVKFVRYLDTLIENDVDKFDIAINLQMCFMKSEDSNKLKAITLLFGEITKNENAVSKIFDWICEKVFKNYKRYRRYEVGCKIAKFIESTVSDEKGKSIRYYDFDQKYCMSRIEICKLLIYIVKLSGFM